MAGLTPEQQRLIQFYRNQRLAATNSPEGWGIYDKLAAQGVRGDDPRLQSQAGVSGHAQRVDLNAALARPGYLAGRYAGQTTPANIAARRQLENKPFPQAREAIMGQLGLDPYAPTPGQTGIAGLGLLGGEAVAPIAGRLAGAVGPRLAAAAEDVHPLIKNLMAKAGPLVRRVQQMADETGLPFESIIKHAQQAFRGAAKGLRDVVETVRPPRGEDIGPGAPKPKAAAGRATRAARQQAKADVNAKTEGPGTGLKATRRGASKDLNRATPPKKDPSKFEKDITARAKKTEAKKPSDAEVKTVTKNVGMGDVKKSAEASSRYTRRYGRQTTAKGDSPQYASMRKSAGRNIIRKARAKKSDEEP